ELHAGFTLPAGAGAVALSRYYNGQMQVIDYLTYANLWPDRSFGSFPDAQAFDRQNFSYPTPGAPNNGTSEPITVVINEWLAGNTNILLDPLTGKYEDWFELYNYGSNTVNLAGYYLSHTPTNRFEFEIPAGYSIPPNGFLLVWADKKTATGTSDLHVNFKLSKDGSSIGLFGADGRTIDSVSFGAQTSNISMGRFPDGSPTLFSMNRPSPGSANIPPNQAP